MKNLLFVLLAVSILSSCVSKKKFVELETSKASLEAKYGNLKKTNLALQNENATQLQNINSLQSQIVQLKNDTAKLNKDLAELNANYSLLNDSYEMLRLKLTRQLEGKEKEIVELQNNLLQATKKVKSRENELLLLAKDLYEQKKEFELVQSEYEKADAQLKEAQGDLKEKEKALIELQTVLSRQDSLVKALKKTVSQAFLGYEGKGLKVEMKNGKVYVSLEEKLLFATGSTHVDDKGVEALKKLSHVLEKDTTINVLIEGHTDDIPYVTSVGGIKDNWDLSVMRATSIVRIILKYGNIDPKRLIPAGRGPYVPVDATSSPEARAKNRRIEIILTPQLDKILRALETN